MHSKASNVHAITHKRYIKYDVLKFQLLNSKTSTDCWLFSGETTLTSTEPQVVITVIGGDKASHK
jgi:hypothetical protein